MDGRQWGGGGAGNGNGCWCMYGNMLYYSILGVGYKMLIFDEHD